VLLLTNIPDKLLQWIYSKAKIFVLPSISEGLPLSLLEAMSSGCIPVVSKIPEISTMIPPEVVVFIKPNDVEELKRKLEELIVNENLARTKSMLVREFIRKNYDWSVIATRIARIYYSLLNGK